MLAPKKSFLSVEKTFCHIDIQRIYYTTYYIFADFVKSEFNSHGIPSLSQFPIFHPHMSLVNLAKTQQKWLSQFWPSIELEWEKRLLGTQQVHGTSIQVLYENVVKATRLID